MDEIWTVSINGMNRTVHFLYVSNSVFDQVAARVTRQGYFGFSNPEKFLTLKMMMQSFYVAAQNY